MSLFWSVLHPTTTPTKSVSEAEHFACQTALTQIYSQLNLLCAYWRKLLAVSVKNRTAAALLVVFKHGSERLRSAQNVPCDTHAWWNHRLERQFYGHLSVCPTHWSFKQVSCVVSAICQLGNLVNFLQFHWLLNKMSLMHLRWTGTLLKYFLSNIFLYQQWITWPIHENCTLVWITVPLARLAVATWPNTIGRELARNHVHHWLQLFIKGVCIVECLCCAAPRCQVKESGRKQ